MINISTVLCKMSSFIKVQIPINSMSSFMYFFIWRFLSFYYVPKIADFIRYFDKFRDIWTFYTQKAATVRCKTEI